MSRPTRAEFWRRATLHLGLTLVALAAVGSAISLRERTALIREEEEHLLLLETLRSASLSRYLQSASSEIVVWSSHGPPRQALAGFKSAWRELGPRAPEILRDLYIERNPFPPSERYRLENAGDASTYTRLHSVIQPAVKRFLDIMGYYDVFLCDPQGNIVYSYFKETDFSTNLVSGPWKDTGLADAFRAARDAEASDFVAFTDFELYAPSNDEPASFIAGPVRAESGELLGVLAFQIPTDRIHEIMQFTSGMGETGETYIVGGDLLMRSDSRFSEESTILETTVNTETVRRALDGQSGVGVTKDYRGETVLSAYGPLDFGGVRWAVMAEIDRAEVLQPLNRLRYRLLLSSLIILLVLGVVLAARSAWEAA